MRCRLTARQCATVLARAGRQEALSRWPETGRGSTRPFAALAQVQDKVSAFRTLARVGVPQPPATVAASAAELEAAGAELAGAGLAGWPLFVKMPIGTASAGVRRVGSPDELRQVAADYERLGAFGPEGVLVQQPVAGRLAMVQSVFARGELVAFHACERVREGAAGGSSHKLGLDLPEAREHLTRLGAALDWHGALSADVILGPDGPRFIDINPRLVEPVNALACGVDLAGALVEVARSGSARSLEPQPAAMPGARTHQLLLAVLGAAQRGSRREVARELRRCRARPRLLPGQPGRADAGAARPAGPAPGRGHRPGHAGAARRVAALHRRQHQRLLAHPGGLAADPPGGRRARRRPGRGRARAAVQPGQPPLTCCTPETVPCAVCNAEPTDEVPVIAAWIAVQMACDTFG